MRRVLSALAISTVCTCLIGCSNPTIAHSSKEGDVNENVGHFRTTARPDVLAVADEVSNETDVKVLLAVLTDVIRFEKYCPAGESVVCVADTIAVPRRTIELIVNEERVRSLMLSATTASKSNVPGELCSSLYRRNEHPVSLLHLGGVDSRVIIEEASDERNARTPFKSQYPAARTRVGMLLPGYSSDNTLAVVYFAFALSPHGADGLYVLEVIEGEWHVKSRSMRYKG